MPVQPAASVCTLVVVERNTSKQRVHRNHPDVPHANGFNGFLRVFVSAKSGQNVGNGGGSHQPPVPGSGAVSCSNALEGPGRGERWNRTRFLVLLKTDSEGALEPEPDARKGSWMMAQK